MWRLITAFAFTLLSWNAQAQTARLSCEGEVRRQNDGKTDNDIYLVTIDQAGKAVTVGSWGSASIIGQTDEVLTFVGTESPGVSSGSINRFTGAAAIHIITMTDGLYSFYGTCKSATRLF
jgi:hypothetical protein